MLHNRIGVLRSVVLILLIPSWVGAQQMDSTYQALGNMPQGKSKVDGYISFMEKYYAQDFDKTYEVAHKVLEISEKIDYADGVKEAYGWLGFIENTYGNDSLAIVYNRKCLKISRKLNDVTMMKSVLNNLAQIYSIRGNDEKAIELFKEVIELHDEFGGATGLGATYLNLGHIYERRGNLEKAFEYAFEGLRTYEKYKDTAGLAGAANMVGLMYRSSKDHEKAEAYFKQALKYGEKSNHVRIEAQALNNLGLTSMHKGNTNEAIKHFKKSLKIRKAINDKRGQAESCYNLASVYIDIEELDSSNYYFSISSRLDKETGDMLGLIQSEMGRGNIQMRRGQVEKALSYYEKALAMAEKVEYAEQLKSIHAKLIELYSQKGNYKKAVDSYMAYDTLKFNLISQENSKSIARKEARYEYEKKAVKDSLNAVQTEMQLKQEKKIQKEKIEKQNIFIVSGGAGLFLLGGLVLLLFKSNRIKQKSNKVINAQKKEVEFQKHVIEEKNLEVVDSIQYAKRLQTAVLPEESAFKQYFDDSFVLFRPKDIVSGDFYWVEHIEHPKHQKEQLIFFAAADCTGHGVPGAMVSLVCVNALNKAVHELDQVDPATILDTCRDIVIDTFSKTGGDVQDGMDISLGVLDTFNDSLRWAGANNPLWMIKQDGDYADSYIEEISATTKTTRIEDSNSILIEIKADKQPIGMFGDQTPFVSHKIPVGKGDQLYMFSDGFADQFGGGDRPGVKREGKKLKSLAFKKILLEYSLKSMDEQQLLLADFFEKWKGDLEQIDDVCVVGVRI